MTLGTFIIIVALITFVALVIGLHYRSGGFRFGVRGGTDVTTPDAEGETTDAPDESPGRRPD